uniref:Proteasome subunit beta n=1 Tax=Suricata suricatta TaxID=37032 RepID=A0A673VL57_SURSU
MSIMSYNGGAVMAMKGKNCVAIAADRRFGIQAQMVTTDFQKIFPMGDRLYIGLAGLATDVQTVSQVSRTCDLEMPPGGTKATVAIKASVTVDAQRLKFRLNLYELKEGRQIKPYTLMSMVANLLYEKRRIGKKGLLPKKAGNARSGAACFQATEFPPQSVPWSHPARSHPHSRARPVSPRASGPQDWVRPLLHRASDRRAGPEDL